MFSIVGKSLGLMSKQQRVLYWTLLVGRTLSGLFDIVGVLLVGFMGAIAAGQFASSNTTNLFLGKWLNQFSNPGNLVTIAIITLGFFVLKSIVAIGITKKQSKLLATVESQLAKRTFDSMLYQSRIISEKWSQAELSYGLTTSMHAAFGRLLSYFTTVIAESFLLICISIVLLLVSPLTMAFVVLYFLLVGFLVHQLVSKRHRYYGIELADANVGSMTTINESLSAFREIFTLGRQPYFVRKFSNDQSRVASSAGTIQYLQSLPRYIVELALMVGAVALIGSQAATGNIASAAAVLGVFLTAGMRIIASILPLQGAIGSIGEVTEQSVLAHELCDTYQSLAINQSTNDSEKLIDSEAGIEVMLDKVTFSYPGAEEPSLNELTLKIESGQFCAVIGPSGSGKSTLADTVLGLLRPKSGSIKVGGISPELIDQMNSGMLAYVPQKPGLVSGTIAQNVALGIPEESIDFERVNEVLEIANLKEFILGLPKGIHELVGKQSNSLSGGQIQRLGLARALYSRPRLLVLDEATSALDAESEAIVSSALAELSGELTLIVIAHRLSTVQGADNVFVLEQGKLLASGTFQHLRDTVPVVAKYADLMSISVEQTSIGELN